MSREGVQRDILPIVEGSVINTKYGPVKTDHILFIGAGAFHTAKPTDLIPELQGRFPIRVELESLTKDDFVNILTVPENALIKQHKALLETEGVEVEFTEERHRRDCDHVVSDERADRKHRGKKAAHSAWKSSLKIFRSTYLMLSRKRS